MNWPQPRPQPDGPLCPTEAASVRDYRFAESAQLFTIDTSSVVGTGVLQDIPRFGRVKPQLQLVAVRLLARGRQPSRSDRGRTGGVLYLERANLYGTLPASRADLLDGDVEAVSLFRQPQVFHPGNPLRAAWGDAGSAGPAGRRILPIQIETPPEGTRHPQSARTCSRGSGCGVGQPGARSCDAAFS